MSHPSTELSTSTTFPNEVWIWVFSHLVDGKSLHAVILTSWRFHNLGMDELLRTLVWKTTERAKNNLQFWEKNKHLAYIPTSLSLNLARRRDPGIGDLPLILNHVPGFQNLDTLSLSNVILPPVFYHVLLSLPNLTHLELLTCRVSDAPPHFPFSFPSFLEQDSRGIEIGITHLSLSNVRRDSPLPGTFHFHIDLLTFLPVLESLTLDDFPSVPDSVLQQLTSLTLRPAPSPDVVVHQLNAYLPHTQNLLHLTIGAPEAPAREILPQIVPTAPLLETLTAPESIAHGVLLGSPLLQSLTINTPFAKKQNALDIIERIHGATLRTLALTLTEWDDEVLLAIAYRLPACRSVKVVFTFAQPSDAFLFNLGVEHLPLLAELRTLHIHARAPDPAPPPPPDPSADDYGMMGLGPGLGFPWRVRAAPKKAEEKETRVMAVPPAEDACAEYLAAWTRYNGELREVRFVSGRGWLRECGGRWGLRSVEVGS
ncbi:hypothetical protein DFH09DRAFT_1426092 [Mycena vulgaris]|nr:hypothetical protein DFH09DRAFT_1426092 [Mycena vulgaris]